MALINVAIKFGDEYFCFGIYFFKIFLFRTCLEIFFIKNFFSKIKKKILFLRALLSMLSVYRDKTDSIYMCIKNMISKRSKLDFSSYCSHHTRREKFNSCSATHNVLLYIFQNMLYLIEVLKCFLDGI